MIQVIAFNGKPVKNLKNLANMVEACKEEYLKFDLDYDQVLSLTDLVFSYPSGTLKVILLFLQIVVLQTKNAKAATSDILAMHCIPSAMSDDLKA